MLAGVAGLGWLAADVVLFRTELASDWPTRVGLTILFGVATLGYVGMLGVSFGVLSRPFILSSLVAVAAGLVLGRHFQRGHARVARDSQVSDAMGPHLSGSPRLRRAMVVVGGLILGASLAHAAMSPVQEWDATVYHAESARQWFQSRPDPPAVFGPSVGIEISANYPPLFPASAAALTTIIGYFDDLYVRLASPVLLLATVLIMFGYSRKRFDERTACFAVLLILGTPLFLLYASWPTGYTLLACLLLATVILVDLAVRIGGNARWVAAGVVAGLAMLTSFYGAVALLTGLAAVVLHRRLQLKTAVLLVLVALAVAAPWLLRNLVVLGDPIYPLGTPPFHGKGIVEPLWTASRDEISRNALGYWSGSHGLWLRVRQLTSALFDRQMLPIGLYFGLLLGLAARRREPVMAYLAVVLLGLVFVVLVPGWFWLRSLVPAIPIAAILTGRVLSALLTSSAGKAQRWPRARAALHVAVVVSVTTAVVAGSIVGLSLAIAGPNQYTWTTGLNRRDNLMRAVENLGSPREQLWSTFTGDLLMWEWLNRYVPAGERIGTLEFRTYYIDHPQDLFYLDGVEAVPLLDMQTPEQVLRFFNEQGVRYIALPSWSTQGPSRHPVEHLLPLFWMLGGRAFPVVATFAIGGSDEPSVVYSVGPTDHEPRIGVFPGTTASAVTLDNSLLTIAPYRVDPRIFVPVPQDRAAALVFEYETTGSGRFDVNLFESSSSRWREGVFVSKRTGYPGWAEAILPLPASDQPFFDLGVYAIGGPLHLRGLRLIEPTEPFVRAAAHAALETSAGSHELAASDPQVRLFVPVGASGHAALRFSYFDGGGGPFDVNVYNPYSQRWTGLRSVDRAGTREWKSVVLPVRSPRPGFVEVGVFARGRPLHIDGLAVWPTQAASMEIR